MTWRPDERRPFEPLAALGLGCVVFVVLTLVAAFLCAALVEIDSSAVRLALLGSGVVLGDAGASVACWRMLRTVARTLPDGLLVPSFTTGVLALLSVAGIVWQLVSGAGSRQSSSSSDP